MEKDNLKKIRVMVDDKLVDSSMFARAPVENFVRNAVGNIIEVDTNILVKEMSAYYSTIVDSLSQLPKNSDKFNLDNVSFTLGIDSSGKVSLISTLSGSAKVQMGLTFNLSTVKK